MPCNTSARDCIALQHCPAWRLVHATFWLFQKIGRRLRLYSTSSRAGIALQHLPVRQIFERGWCVPGKKGNSILMMSKRICLCQKRKGGNMANPVGRKKWLAGETLRLCAARCSHWSAGFVRGVQADNLLVLMRVNTSIACAPVVGDGASKCGCDGDIFDIGFYLRDKNGRGLAPKRVRFAKMRKPV